MASALAGYMPECSDSVDSRLGNSVPPQLLITLPTHHKHNTGSHLWTAPRAPRGPLLTPGCHVGLPTLLGLPKAPS